MVIWLGHALASSHRVASVPVSPRLGQATDVTVTEAVVDEDEKLAGGRYPPDLGSPAPTHLRMVTPNRGVISLAGDGLDGRPAHEPTALFGDVASADLVVGLVVGGGKSGPRLSTRMR